MTGFSSLPNLGYDFNKDLYTLQSEFNITRLPDFNNAPDAYIGHIIMTRPSLNFTPHSDISSTAVLEGSTTNNTESMKSIGEMCEYVTDKTLYKLVSSLSDYAKYKYLPIISTRAKTYTTMEPELKVNDSNATFFGHTIKYGQRSEEHKKGKSITIDFRNDRFLSIYHLMNFWSLYIKYISNTSYLSPTNHNAMYAVLDYGASMYYFVTKRNNRELVYWEKLEGIYPTHISSSQLFNYSDGMINPEDTLSVDFTYSIAADPKDPSILEDINELTFGSSKINESRKVNISRTNYGLIVEQTRAKYPYIKSYKHSRTGKIINELLWTR